MRPSGATTVVSRATRSRGAARQRWAAAVTSRARAPAAAARSGPYRAWIVLDPPVSWLNSSSGRASSRTTSTSASRASISSATTWATAVVMPCPTSARGSRTTTRSAAVTSITSRCCVGRAASVSASLKSTSSATWAPAGASCPTTASAMRTPTASVGAAAAYSRNRRRVIPVDVLFPPSESPLLRSCAAPGSAPVSPTGRSAPTSGRGTVGPRRSAARRRRGR